MKEVVIPITWEQVSKVGICALFILGVTGFIYGIIIGDKSLSILGLVMGCGIGYFVAYIGSWEYSWDLNPFHKIGYCIRLKEPWENKIQTVGSV